MHELTFTQNVLDLAIKHADGYKITDVYLVLGHLTSMVNDCVQFYWDMISAGTLAEGSVLHFKRIPAQMRCMDCATQSELTEQLTCSNCGSVNMRIITGNENYLEAIDIREEA